MQTSKNIGVQRLKIEGSLHYERDAGLPIRRPSGRLRGAVIVNSLEFKHGSLDCRRVKGGHDMRLKTFRSSMGENHRLRSESDAS